MFLVLFGLNFVSADLDDNIKAYWKLDETSGSVALDSVSGNFNGTNNDLTLNPTGLIGGSYNFSTIISNLTMSDSTWNSSNNMTLSFWILFNENTTENANIWYWEDTDTVPQCIWRLASASDMITTCFDSGGSDFVFSTSGYDTGIYNHYVLQITNDGTGNATLWLNGVVVGNDNTVNFTHTGAKITHVFGDYGGGGGAGPSFNGSLDEIGWWDRYLTPSEIQELYNNSSGVTYEPSPPLPPPLENATFENVNITNNLDVGQDVSALNGFFDFIGSSVSRIMKGWFVDIDVSGTSNLTGNTYITSASCSAGQVLTTSTTGLVSCTNIVDVKSGSAFVVEDSCTSISFSSNFASTPVVTGNVDNSGDDNVVSISSLSTSGFDLCLSKVGGGGGNYTVYWIATNAGNS